jgi:hypothetical protein
MEPYMQEMKQVMKQYFLLLNGSNKMKGNFHPALDDTYSTGTGGHSWKAVSSYRFTCLREFAIVAQGIMNLTGARLYLPLGQPPQHYVGETYYMPYPTDIQYIWDGYEWQPH